MHYYLGIDVGKFHHQAILCDDQAKPVIGSLKFKATFDGFQQLFAYVRQQVPEGTVIHAGVEATGAYWITVYEQLLKHQIRVSVLNPLQVKAYRNEGIRGAKTDRLDALLIVKVLRFGDYRESAIPPADLFALRQLTRLRFDLVSVTSDLKRKVICIFDQIFPEYKELFSNLFGTSSKTLLAKAVTPEDIAAISTRKLTTLLEKASFGRYGAKQALAIKKKAEQSIGITLGIDAFTLSVKILLAQVGHLEEQTQKLEEEISQRVAGQQTTLTTIPGIGRIQEATILAEIGNFERFRNDKDGAEKLVAIAGIDPKVKQSGKYQGKAKMSKRGSPYLRTAIRQIAFNAACMRKDAMFARIFQKKVAEGKPHEVALSHVENKLLHVIYSLLKSKKEYVPN